MESWAGRRESAAASRVLETAPEVGKEIGGRRGKKSASANTANSKENDRRLVSWGKNTSPDEKNEIKWSRMICCCCDEVPHHKGRQMAKLATAYYLCSKPWKGQVYISPGRARLMKIYRDDRVVNC